MVLRKRRRGVLDERTAAARSRRRGIIGVIVIVSALAASAFAYLNPTGQTRYSAHLATAAGVRAGDEVRIAGVKVGKVTSVRLDGTVVDMEFEVNRSVAVGSESTLEVKLLTPLGGHYMALDPKGALPLGRKVIPPERTATPYEINDILQAATPLVEQVNGQVIHDTFTEVANAANKYPDALRDVIESAHALTRSLSQVTADFYRGLDFTNNSMRALITRRTQFLSVVEQLAHIGQLYTSKAVDIVEYFTVLDELARIVDRAITFYGREIAPWVNAIDDILDTLFADPAPERLAKAAAGYDQLMHVLVPMLSGNGVAIDQRDRLMPGQDLCLPSIMRHC
ncbi:MlaD family protein [Mycobacterium branderi]|uniref:Mammalian cell entry protein n=1 Tax=Mycobacterium branderi TaxID=43348 RepID=A0A7I7W2S2_9MYCO|nr:MlaD family protein [Mycobacterium branderi]MCV7233584.1 MCE family protein [Mycobacterium branderi]ORA41616.1 mammalian cell entry protein [Mycobacterium branderi]BBZ10703.1 putative Mce family protein [Mycobacterium branderi]